jgi:hypothetical protein
MLLIAVVVVEVTLAVGVVVALRQIALVSVNLGLTDREGAPESQELAAGADLPEEVLAVAPQLAAGLSYLVWVTPDCGSCHEFVKQFTEQSQSADRFPESVLVVLSGDGDSADRMDGTLAGAATVLREPATGTVVRRLGMRVSPYTIEVEDGVITGWSTLQGMDDLWNLHQARASSNAHELAVSALARKGDKT